MNAQVNRYMLMQTSWDSGLLTPLASVMHSFQQPGQYQGIVFLGRETVGLFDLVVDEKAADTQVNIDLEVVYQRRHAQTKGENPLVVHPRKPTAFYVGRGRGGYSVVVHRLQVGQRASEFDSRELRDGDVFTVTPIRSGIYSFTNHDAAKGKFHVQKSEGQSIPTEPVIVECVENEFRPNQASTKFSQPLFFMIRTPSRIKVQLEKRPEEAGQPRRPSIRRQRDATQRS